jgi:hypothetical protein
MKKDKFGSLKEQKSFIGLPPGWMIEIVSLDVVILADKAVYVYDVLNKCVFHNVFSLFLLP